MSAGRCRRSYDVPDRPKRPEPGAWFGGQYSTNEHLMVDQLHRGSGGDAELPVRLDGLLRFGAMDPLWTRGQGTSGSRKWDAVHEGVKPSTR